MKFVAPGFIPYIFFLWFKTFHFVLGYSQLTMVWCSGEQWRDSAIHTHVCACSVASVMSNSLWLYGLQPTRLLSPWDFPGKNTEVGCFSRGSSWPRIEPKSPVSLALAGRFFTTSSLIGLFGHNWQINTDTLLLSFFFPLIGASLIVQLVKNPPAM